MDISKCVDANQVSSSSILRQYEWLGRLFLSKKLNFNMQAQTESNWCWAATSCSVSMFYWTGSTWTQCKVACEELGRTDCCLSPVPSACNVPWYLDRALTRTNNFVSITGPISYANVKAEIDAGRPVGARVGWSGGGGHFMVIYGYSTAGNAQYFNIDDPIYGKSTPTVANFSSSYQGSGTWTHSYYTKSYSPIIMPLDIPDLSDLVLKGIYDQRPLLAFNRGETDFAKSSEKETAFGLGHRVFVLGLDDLDKPEPKPRQSCLRAFELEKSKPVAFFDVDESTGVVQQMSDSADYSERFFKGFQKGLQLAEKQQTAADLRLLRLPAVHFEAIWIHTEVEEFLIPLRTVDDLVAFEIVTMSKVIESLKSAKEALGEMDELMGN